MEVWALLTLAGLLVAAFVLGCIVASLICQCYSERKRTLTTTPNYRRVEPELKIDDGEPLQELPVEESV